MKEPNCCCPSHDQKLCVALRYNLDPDTMDPDDICDCYCHDPDEEDDA